MFDLTAKPERLFGTGRRAWLPIAILLLAAGPAAAVQADGAAGAAAGETPARAAVETGYARLRELTERGARPAGEIEAEIGDFVADLFALEWLAPQLLPQQWADLSEHDRGMLVQALGAAIRHRALAYLGDDAPGEMRFLSGSGGGDSDGSARLDYEVSIGDRRETVTLHLLRMPDEGWRIREVMRDGTPLLSGFQRVATRLLEEYSFPYMVAELGGSGVVVLEDFESGPLDTLPAGWTWRGRDAEKHKPYRVREENGNRYLEARDEGESVILGKTLKWDLRRYPYVSFRWRVNEIPENGDERFDERVDSAAGIYFIYKKKMLGLIPESVKYVWSSTLPVGSATRRQGTGKPWMVVAGSGSDGLGEWRTFVFDLRKAYEDTFGGHPPDKPIGIGILSDANSTHSHAYADYDDILALQSADPSVTSGVEEILEANPK
ncbi:MAG: DUF3047 domain-containing protein [Gemmatimonadota bacterium]